MSRAASEGWERWPVHKDLITGAWLCRWCHKPLSGRHTAWCSQACKSEVTRRCDWVAARRVLFKRQHGVCQKCGLNTEALHDALRWYESMHRRVFFGLGQKLTPAEDLRRRMLVKHWPDPNDFARAIHPKVAAAYRVMHPLWEANHVRALAEGGALCDQDNLETLCVICHLEHTAGVVRRVAEVRRARKGAKD